MGWCNKRRVRSTRVHRRGAESAAVSLRIVY